MPKIKIVLNPKGEGTIEIDGHQLKNVIALNVRARGGKRARVFLELIGDIEIEAEPDVINTKRGGIPLQIVRGPPK